MIEELLDALESNESIQGTKDTEPEEVVMAVDRPQAENGQKRRTLRLCGQIGKFPVLILVDSSSVGTFISSALAARLPHALSECAPTQFVTADGTPMTCGQKIQATLDVSGTYICV